MGRKNNDDDASKWTGSDMHEDQEKLEDVWVVDQTTFMKADEWERSEKMLRRNAASQKKVVHAEKVRGGYKVTVQHREKRKKK